MKTIITFVLLTLLSINLMAQNEIFTVLASKGKNSISSADVSRQIKIGEKIKSTDKITVEIGGYLGLAHKDGRTVEVKKAGTYNADKLVLEVAAQNASMGKKYVDFMVGEMTAKNEDMVSNRHKYMDVTGSVERGDNAINAFVLKEAYVLPDSKILIKWQPVKNTKTYVVKISNMFDETIFSIETNGDEITLDLLSVKCYEQTLILSIVSKDNSNIKSDEFGIWQNVNQDVILQDQELKKQLSEPTALNKVAIALFYEDKKLLLNAMENYESAIKMEPEVEEYKVMYGKFLERNGFVNIK